MTDQDYTDIPGAPGADEPPPRPAFLKRLWMVFVQPGDLFNALALNPAWFPMLVLVAVVTGATMWFIPAEAFEAQMLGRMPADQPAQMPAIPPAVLRATATGGAAVVTFVFAIILSLVTYVIFVFIRGDKATLKQHLSVISHAGIIVAFGALFVLPIRILSVDVTRTLSVGTFLPFLPEGYVHNLLTGLDLFSLWAAVVAGLGLSLLDPRRRWGPTATVMIALVVIAAAIGAIFGR